MNKFHEINILTSRGDIHGAFALIRGWHEGVARKIMKKAGYSVTPHTGRAFWLWVQQTLLQAARSRNSGYQARAERKIPVRRHPQQMQEDWIAYEEMMASPAQSGLIPERNELPVSSSPDVSAGTVMNAEHPTAEDGQPESDGSGTSGKPEPGVVRNADGITDVLRFYIMSVRQSVPGLRVEREQGSPGRFFSDTCRHQQHCVKKITGDIASFLRRETLRNTGIVVRCSLYSAYATKKLRLLNDRNKAVIRSYKKDCACAAGYHRRKDTEP